MNKNLTSFSNEERPRLFLGLETIAYTQTIAAARVKVFNRNEVLYLEGEPVKQVFVVASGMVKTTKVAPSGAEVIVRLSVPGDVLGLSDQLSTGTYCTSAQGFRDGQLLVWDPSTFRSLVARFPVLHENMLRILSEDLLDLQERFREVATDRVGARVARQLIRLAEKAGVPVQGTNEISLSREELAQMTGTTLFSVSRLLSAWEARGLVKSRREAVTICEVQSLRALSNAADGCETPVSTIDSRVEMRV